MAGRWGESGRRGMTLIELLVVIMIIGILIGLLLPGVHAAMVLASITEVRSDLRQVEAALRQYVTHFDMFPPTRQYTAASTRHKDYCLPQELWETGYLNEPLLDPFNPGEMYCYKAIGPLMVNDGGPTLLAFDVPANFPKSGGTPKKEYTYAEWFKAPVRLIIWSAGPNGRPVETCYTTEDLNAEDPANWYPERPNGIICLYYDGNDWLFSY